ncbi:MAG: hypothetical protein ACYC1U_01955 [Candidatus Aquicultorales bacterium]
MIIASALLWTRRRTAWVVMVWVLLVSFLFEAALSAPGVYRIVQRALSNQDASDTIQFVRAELAAVVLAVVALITLFSFLYMMLPWVHHRFK